MTAEEPVLLADDRGRYVDANDAAIDLLGYTREEILELSVWDLTPEADEIQGYQLWQEFIRQGTHAGIYRLRRKDESVIWVRYRAIANVAPGRHRSTLTPIPPGLEPAM